MVKMNSYTFTTETITRRKYYVRGNSREEAEETFAEIGGDLEDEEILQENIESVVEVESGK